MSDKNLMFGLRRDDSILNSQAKKKVDKLSFVQNLASFLLPISVKKYEINFRYVSN